MSEVPPRNALNLWKNGPVALALEGADGQARMLGANNPLPVTLAPGATVDPDSNREATQQEILAQVILAVSALQVLSGNTDGLETFAQQSRDLLTQLTGYNDGVESLLGSIGNNTDGIEGLLSALGLKDDNVLSKLGEILAKNEAIRALLAGTLAVSAAALPLPTGASTAARQDAAKTVLDAIAAALGPLATDAKSEQIRLLLADLKATLATQAAKTDTQPVSLATIPLAPGASTEATLAAQKAVIDLIKARLDLLGTDAKLEQLRLLLAGTLAVSVAALPLPAGASTSALQTAGNTTLTGILTALQAALPLPTGASTAALQTAGNTTLASILTALGNTLAVKLNPDASVTIANTIAAASSTDAGINYGNRALVAVTFGPNMVATSFYFEHSVDGGVTYNPVYDGYGNAYQYVGASSRTVKVAPIDFARLGLVRLRLGTVGNPVAQGASALSVTYTLAFL